MAHPSLPQPAAMPPRFLADEELIRRFITEQNEHYFALLYARYQRKAYGQVYAYVRDSALAQDLTQDLFIKLVDRLDRFEGRSTFSTWFFAFIRNGVLDYLRRERRLRRAARRALPGEDLSEELLPEELLLQAEEMVPFPQLHQALARLTPEDRQILTLMYAQDWQMDEIAEWLDLSISAVKMRIKRAKARARASMDAQPQA